MKKPLVLAILAAIVLAAMVAVTFLVVLPAFNNVRAEPTPQQSQSPSVSPSVSPEPELVQKRLVITADDIQLFDENGTLATKFTYFGDSAKAVASLTDFFSADPVVTNTPGKNTNEFPADLYTWGGFVIRDSTAEVHEMWNEEFNVYVTTSDVNGTSIETIDGLKIGSKARDVASSQPGTERRYTAPDGVEHQWFTIGIVNYGPPEGATEDETMHIQLTSDTPGGVIAIIYAPVPNNGP